MVVWAELWAARWLVGMAGAPSHSPAPPWRGSKPSHVRTQVLRFLRQMLNLRNIFLQHQPFII